jgi:hypothetical protein
VRRLQGHRKTRGVKTLELVAYVVFIVAMLAVVFIFARTTA